MSNTAASQYQSAFRLEKEHVTHSDRGTSSVGICAHCQSHGVHLTGITANTVTMNDEHDATRQRILMEICQAKKRQARMEADEARRLQDEARRLAE